MKLSRAVLVFPLALLACKTTASVTAASPGEDELAATDEDRRNAIGTFTLEFPASGPDMREGENGSPIKAYRLSMGRDGDTNLVIEYHDQSDRAPREQYSFYVNDIAKTVVGDAGSYLNLSDIKYQLKKGSRVYSERRLGELLSATSTIKFGSVYLLTTKLNSMLEEIIAVHPNAKYIGHIARVKQAHYQLKRLGMQLLNGATFIQYDPSRADSQLTFVRSGGEITPNNSTTLLDVQSVNIGHEFSEFGVSSADVKSTTAYSINLDGDLLSIDLTAGTIKKQVTYDLSVADAHFQPSVKWRAAALFGRAARSMLFGTETAPVRSAVSGQLQFKAGLDALHKQLSASSEGESTRAAGEFLTALAAIIAVAVPTADVEAVKLTEAADTADGAESKTAQAPKADAASDAADRTSDGEASTADELARRAARR